MGRDRGKSIRLCAVSQATGLNRNTIAEGIKEIEKDEILEKGSIKQIRKTGGGRKTTQNWRGRPLTSRQVVVNLISHTTTNKGLKIRAMLDENTYDTGIKVSNADINSIALKKRRFHGDWNYQIKPRKST